MKINVYSNMHSNTNNLKNNSITFGWKEHSFEAIRDSEEPKRTKSKEEIEHFRKVSELNRIRQSIDAIEFHGKEAPAHLYESYWKLRRELNF